MTDHVFAGLLTRADLAPQARAERFLKLVEEELPQFVPRRYGADEPVRMEYTTRQEAASGWGEGFIWKGQTASLEGTLYPRAMDGTSHSSVEFSGRLKAVGVASLVRFLKLAAVEFDADFGYLHLINDEEVKTSAPDTIGGTGDHDRALIVATPDIKRYLPDLYWGTILGRVYTEKFGKGSLQEASAARVCQLANESFYLQLSDDIRDMHSRFEEIESVRSAVKSHLGREWFYDPTKPRSHRYRVPCELAEA